MISAYNDTPIFVNQEYDPEERLAKAIIKSVADDYIDATWMVYCYDHIIADFEESEKWLLYKKAEADINATRTQVESIREAIRKNATVCNRMGGRTDNCFPYAAIRERLPEADDQAYINQLSVNRDYMIEWRKAIEMLQEMQKRLTRKENNLQASYLMNVKREHDYLVSHRKMQSGVVTAKARWFNTKWAKTLMMSDISQETIIRQLKKRSEANIKRMKKDRIEAGMHPYDFTQDTTEQKKKFQKILSRRREVSV